MADLRVDQRGFQDFCRQGRLVGTEQNAAAVRFLENSLKDRGFEVHTYTDRREISRPIATGMGVVAFAIFYWLKTRTVVTPAIAMMMLGPLVRGAYYISKGTPLAVFGVRSSSSGSSPSTPTVVIGAHFDSASATLAGSLITQWVRLLLFAEACWLLGEYVSPFVAVLAAAAGGYVMFRNDSPGGDDNASGVFGVLDCLDRLSDLEGVNIIPVFFNFEEEGLFGSASFFRRYLSRRSGDLPGLGVSGENAYMINFDCVGRGKRVFVSGDGKLIKTILQTRTAREAKVSPTSFYASDHLVFKRPWRAVSFARADRFWMLDLKWLHSAADVPEKVDFTYIDEVAGIAEECVREIAQA